MSNSRWALSSQAIGNKIYAMGGVGAGDASSLEIYNTETNTWADGAPMLTACYAFSSSVVNNKIFIIGGVDENSLKLNAVEIYNPATDTWTTGPAMNTARSYLSASVVGNKIYAIGGVKDYYVDTVEILDTETNTWTTGTPLPAARQAMTSSVVGKKIYVIGGTIIVNSSALWLNTVDIFDTETNTWATGASMPTARCYATAQVIGKKIYIIGGSDQYNTFNTVEIYDTETNTWTTGTPMPTERKLLSSSVVNNKIYALGGQNSSGSLTTVESFQVTSPAVVPDTPASLTATGGNSVVDLSWGAVTGATSYIVKRSTTAGGPYTVIAEDVTATSYSDTDVVNGTTYYFVVVGANSAGSSPNSNEASATPQAPASSGRALLVITMTNGLEKEYDLTKVEIDRFIEWYDSKTSGSGSGYYTFNKTFNLGPFLSRVDYIAYDKIQNFEIMKYQ